MRGLLCHCRQHLEAEDDAALGVVVREHLMLRHSALEPSEEQVQEIVSTRAYDLTYAEVYAGGEFVFRP
jgi:hypothetical protein